LGDDARRHDDCESYISIFFFVFFVFARFFFVKQVSEQMEQQSCVFAYSAT